MNAPSFAANSSLSLNVNFLANNYYVLAGILFTAAIVLYKPVCQMISCHCFPPPGSLAQCASTSEFVPELPDDILMEILVRLPVSSIFHFRSVSRSFRSFVREAHTCNRLPPVLVGLFSQRMKKVGYISLRNGFGDSSMDYDPTQFLKESSLFYEMKDSKFGLVLCTKSWLSSEIYLCNPVTKECRSIACDGGHDNCRFILAFDPCRSKHHYEVIKISNGSVDRGYSFEVFSSKTGRWDLKFSVTGYYINLELHPCFANGLLYMFAEMYFGLTAINCADGSYKGVALPCSRGGRDGALCNSSGTLMYTKFYRGEVRVWALLKNENESCWLLRHQINLKDKLNEMGFSFPFDTHGDRTLLFHSDTIVLLIHFKRLYYNLETDQLQADMSRRTNGRLLPWSPCYYAVSGL